MTDEEEIQSLREKVETIQADLNGFIQDLCEAPIEKLDPVNQPPLQFDEPPTPITEILDTLKAAGHFLGEMSFMRVLHDLLHSRSLGEGDRQREIGVLFDLALRAREEGAVYHDLLHLLFTEVLRVLPVDWLLSFWNFFELRAQHFKHFNNTELTPAKHPGVPTLLALNMKLDLLAGNNEPRRDVLKAKILTFTSRIFPLFTPFLSNSKFEVNTLTDPEHEFHSKNSRHLFGDFWRVQSVLRNPWRELKSQADVRDFKEDLRTVVDRVIRFEHGHGKDKTKHGTNHLTEEKRADLKKLYDEKTYTPTDFINEDRFIEQLRADSALRKTFYVQLSMLNNCFLNLDKEQVQSALKDRKRQDLYLSQFVVEPRQMAFLKDQVKKIDTTLREKGEAGLISSVVTMNEAEFFQAKLSQFANFTKIYSEFVAADNEKIVENMKKASNIPKRYWAAYGTQQITAHWKTKTGMSILEKPSDELKSEKLQKRIEEYREAIKNNPETKDLNTWKALRLARTISLSKLKQVNQHVGLDGLFDGSLKKLYDEERAAATAEQRAEEERKLQEETEKIEREEAKRKEIEAMREEAAKKKAAAAEERAKNGDGDLEEEKVAAEDEDDTDGGENEKKRKLPDLLAEGTKRTRASTGSTPSAAAEEELDY